MPALARDRDAAVQRLVLWLRGVAGLLVEAQDRLVVEAVAAGDKTLLLVIRTPVAADRGRLIGKDGATIAALRRLLGAVGARTGLSLMLEVADGSADVGNA